jgi:hypothetical protein
VSCSTTVGESDEDAKPTFIDFDLMPTLAPYGLCKIV